MEKAREESRKRGLSVFILPAIFLTALLLRLPVFFLAHNHGDQIFYLGLAMKLQAQGFSGYNLYGIDVNAAADGKLTVCPSSDSTGGLLRSLEGQNISYYSGEKLSNMPPGYSASLLASHKLLGRGPCFAALARNVHPGEKSAAPAHQFYAVIINLVFSLLFIGCVYLLGKSMFGTSVGKWAAALVAFCPVDLLTSQRLWADEGTAFLACLGVYLYWLARNKERYLLYVLSGIAFGAATLFKQSGFFALIAIFVAEVTSALFLRKKPFYPGLLLTLIFWLLTSGFWYFLLTYTYGTPFYIPAAQQAAGQGGWFDMLASRPRLGQLWYFYYLSPVMVLFYLELAIGALKREWDFQRLLCVVWPFTFFLILFLIAGKEERYMLPAYPAIAFFCGLFLERIRLLIIKKAKLRFTLSTIMFLLLAFSFAWSIKQGLSCVHNNRPIFNL